MVWKRVGSGSAGEGRGGQGRGTALALPGDQGDKPVDPPWGE